MRLRTLPLAALLGLALTACTPSTPIAPTLPAPSTTTAAATTTTTPTPAPTITATTHAEPPRGNVKAAPTKAAPSCDKATHYVNSSGNCVPRPVDAATAPAGATAQCQDGTYSFSEHRSGTCSGHHGVARWL